MSYHNNRYLLVIQDLFTNWAEAVPLPDQTANHITEELVKVFILITRYGHPDILHSDQGLNFESVLLRQTLDVFGVSKTRTTSLYTTLKVMKWSTDSIIPCSRCSVLKSGNRQIGNAFPPLVLFVYWTARACIHRTFPISTHVWTTTTMATTFASSCL